MIQEIVGISCSWCGDSYHVSCFSDQFKREPCHLGPLRNSIIPPSWIVKVPPMERVSQRWRERERERGREGGKEGRKEGKKGGMEEGREKGREERKREVNE